MSGLIKITVTDNHSSKEDLHNGRYNEYTAHRFYAKQFLTADQLRNNGYTNLEAADIQLDQIYDSHTLDEALPEIRQFIRNLGFCPTEVIHTMIRDFTIMDRRMGLHRAHLKYKTVPENYDIPTNKAIKHCEGIENHLFHTNTFLDIFPTLGDNCWLVRLQHDFRNHDYAELEDQDLVLISSVPNIIWGKEHIFIDEEEDHEIKTTKFTLPEFNYDAVSFEKRCPFGQVHHVRNVCPFKGYYYGQYEFHCINDYKRALNFAARLCAVMATKTRVPTNNSYFNHNGLAIYYMEKFRTIVETAYTLITYAENQYTLGDIVHHSSERFPEIYLVNFI